ncbi:MAG: class I SAM-dependent methyltransferase [Ignavibacteria bacterium]|jgi:trans-aconitate methyltransferase
MNTIYAGTFNNVSSEYEDGRPGYPEIIYEIVNCYKQFNSNSELLEIGAGNGVSTKEIYEKWLSNITVIEPGKNLCNIMQSKFGDKVKIFNGKFEEYSEGKKYDGIFCATAFHWLDDNKYRRASGLLKDDGILILYWNNYISDNNEVYDSIQTIYEKYHPAVKAAKDYRDIQKQKILERKESLQNSEYFKLVGHHEVITTKTYDSNRYLNLLKSFSENSILEEEKVKNFYNKIEEYIKQNGNKIVIQINTNMEIGIKN